MKSNSLKADPAKRAAFVQQRRTLFKALIFPLVFLMSAIATLVLVLSMASPPI